MTTKIYMAYGSNLNKKQMDDRCPKAEPIGYALFEDHRLVFRGVADMIPAKGFKCPIGLWRITDECEERLDVYEGFPSTYRKEYFNRKLNGNEELLMAYVMNMDGIQPPNQLYYDGIKEGYNDFNIDTDYLEHALAHSRDNKNGKGHTPKRYRTESF